MLSETVGIKDTCEETKTYNINTDSTAVTDAYHEIACSHIEILKPKLTKKLSLAPKTFDTFVKNIKKGFQENRECGMTLYRVRGVKF